MLNYIKNNKLIRYYIQKVGSYKRHIDKLPVHALLAKKISRSHTGGAAAPRKDWVYYWINARAVDRPRTGFDSVTSLERPE